MNNLVTPFTKVLNGELVYALGWTILHSLWQCTLIAALLAVGLQCSKKLSSNSRYLLAYTALLLCFFISLITFHSYWEQAKAARLALTLDAQGIKLPGVVNVQSQFQQWLAGADHYLVWIVVSWLTGCAFMSLRGLADYYRSLHLKDSTDEAVSAHWQQTLATLQTQVQVVQQVSLRISNRITSPCTLGHFKPVILLPVGLLTGISQAHVEVILLHELAHIRRRDYAFGLLQILINILFFFNPMTLWISSIINTERENACDDIAVDICQSPMIFPHALQDVVEIEQSKKAIANQLATSMTMIGKKMSLLNRIKRQFSQRRVVPQAWENFVAVCVLAFSCTTVCVYAQTNTPDTPAEREAQLTNWFNRLPAFASRSVVEQQQIVKQYLIEYDDVIFSTGATGETMVHPDTNAKLIVTNYNDPLKRKFTLNQSMLKLLQGAEALGQYQDKVVVFKDSLGNAVIAVEKTSTPAANELPEIQSAYKNASVINKFFSPNTNYENWQAAEADLTFKVSYQYLFIILSPNLVEQALAEQPMTAGLPVADYHHRSLVGGSPYAGAIKLPNTDLMITYDRTAWELKQKWMTDNQLYANSPNAPAIATKTQTVNQQQQLLEHYTSLLDSRRKQLMLTDTQYENLLTCFHRHYGFVMPDQAKYGLRLGMLQRLYNADEQQLAQMESYYQQQLRRFTLGTDNDQFYVNLLTADFSGCDKK